MKSIASLFIWKGAQTGDWRVKRMIKFDHIHHKHISEPKI